MHFEKKNRTQIRTDIPESGKANGMAPNSPVDIPAESTEDTAIKTYLELLEENGISETHVMKVLDTLITEGTVQWAFTLLDKIPCMFKTRSQDAAKFLMECLEQEDPKSVFRYQSIVAHVNIAASLTKFNNQEFSTDSRESIKANMAWLSEQPFIIVDRLTKQLALFDRVIAVATSDWGVKNFTKPQSEN